MQRQKLILHTYWLIMLISAFAGMDLTAQDETYKKINIGDHVFTPITYSPLPTTSTYINTMAGVGQTINLFHSISITDELEVRGLQGEVTFVDLYIGYQQRIRDWLAAYIHLGMAARLGTEVQSILIQGFNTVSIFELGWQFKIMEGEKSAFSATIELQNREGSFINILGFVKDIINDHPDPKIKENIPLLRVGSELRFAYGFNEFVGISAMAKLSYGETYIRGENGMGFTAGGGVDLDFYPRYSVPLGFIAHYNITSQPEFVFLEGGVAHIGKIKIAYTKSRDYSLGLEYAIMKVPLMNVEKSPFVYTYSLASRFYF